MDRLSRVRRGATHPRTRPVAGGLRVTLALLALALGGHRFVVDHVREELRDVYLAIPVGRLKLDPAIEGGLRIDVSATGVAVRQVGAEQSLWLLSPPLLGLNRQAFARSS